MNMIEPHHHWRGLSGLDLGRRLFNKQRLKRLTVSILGGLFVNALSGMAFAQTDQKFINILVQVTVNDFGPPAGISNLTALSGASEGTVQLKWTAPGDDDMSGTAQGYTVKVATYQITAALFSSAPTYSPSSPWSPLTGGSAEGFSGNRVVSGLEPGVTYYFAIEAFDEFNDAGPWESPLDNPSANGASFTTATDLPPTAPSSVTATASLIQIQLSWSSSTATDYHYFRVERDDTAPPDVFVSITTTTLTSYADTGLTVGNTYFYRIVAVDKGAPLYPGLALESSPSSVLAASLTTPLDAVKPASPIGVRGSFNSTLSTFTVTWSPVLINEDGTPITDLAGYHVCRSNAFTGPYVVRSTISAQGPYSAQDAVSPASGLLYYLLRAYDTSGAESADSLIVDTSVGGDTQAGVTGYDTRLIIPQEIQGILYEGTSSFGDDIRIASKRRTQDENDLVLASYEFTPLMGKTNSPVSGFYFSKPNATLELSYAQQIPAGQSTPSLNPSIDATDFAVYWFNGVEFVNLGGVVNPTRQAITIKTSRLGLYQIRPAARPSQFTLVQVYPRTITPNNDGWNDKVLFQLENPSGGLFRGAIFDVQGRHIRRLETLNGTSTTLSWDGKDDDGEVVRPGVYIYQVEAEGQFYSGTVAVAK